jgi:CheY-like chemotaxis protein
MPVIDGFEASRRIRDLERQRHLQDRRVQSSPSSSPPLEPSKRKSALIVALTGLASAHDRDEALRSGVDLFLTKPVKFQKLGELLGRWEQGEISAAGGAEGGKEEGEAQAGER